VDSLSVRSAVMLQLPESLHDITVTTPSMAAGYAWAGLSGLGK
jgi:hypothetical protein